LIYFKTGVPNSKDYCTFTLSNNNAERHHKQNSKIMKKQFATTGSNTIMVEAKSKKEAVAKIRVYEPAVKTADVQRFN